MATGLYIDGARMESKGVYMGDSFVEQLLTPPTLKEFAQNDARSRDGVQILTSSPKVASRDLTLTFIIAGDTPAEMTANKAALLSMLSKIQIGVYVPEVSDTETFWLTYTGRSVSFSIDLTRTVSKFAAKFTEADPTNRELATWVKDL